MAKVLTVDDSKVVRTMVTKALKPFTCEIVEAVNGQEGVEAAVRERPDLILLDVSMPMMDGLQALTAIRANAATKSTPVIMLIADGDKDRMPEIIRLGVKGYILKPFTAESFGKEVSKVLGAAGTQPAATAARTPTAQVTVATEGGCPVIVCPDPQSKGFGGFVPAAQESLRALADRGSDRFILDLATVTQLNTELVQSLVQLIAAAAKMGMRTGVCAPTAVIDKLKQVGKTEKTVYAPTRRDALGRLG
jgi:CheY-like chemotaxis protein